MFHVNMSDGGRLGCIWAAFGVAWNSSGGNGHLSDSPGTVEFEANNLFCTLCLSSQMPCQPAFRGHMFRVPRIVINPHNQVLYNDERYATVSFSHAERSMQKKNAKLRQLHGETNRSALEAPPPNAHGCIYGPAFPLYSRIL